MNIYFKHTMILALACAAIYLAGCSKSTPAPSAPASIVGSWSQSSLEERLRVNGVIKSDTTLIAPLGSGAFTFTAGGYYVNYTAGGESGGPYTYVGNTLSIFDTINGLNKWVSARVDSLTATTLSLEQPIDSSNHNGLDSVFSFVLNYSR